MSAERRASVAGTEQPGHLMPDPRCPECGSRDSLWGGRCPSCEAQYQREQAVARRDSR